MQTLDYPSSTQMAYYVLITKQLKTLFLTYRYYCSRYYHIVYVLYLENRIDRFWPKKYGKLSPFYTSKSPSFIRYRSPASSLPAEDRDSPKIFCPAPNIIILQHIQDFQKLQTYQLAAPTSSINRLYQALLHQHTPKPHYRTYQHFYFTLSIMRYVLWYNQLL